MCPRREALQARKDAACELAMACSTDLDLLRKYDPERFGMSPIEPHDPDMDDMLRRLD